MTPHPLVRLTTANGFGLGRPTALPAYADDILL